MKKLEFKFNFNDTVTSINQKIGSHGVVTGYIVKVADFTNAITAGFDLIERNSITVKQVTALAKNSTHIYGEGLTNDITMKLPIAPEDTLSATLSGVAGGTGGQVIIILLLD